MFSGRASVRASVRPCVRLSVRPWFTVVLCFRDISSICWRIFAKLLSLAHLGTQMTWLRFWVKRSKFKVTPSRRRRTALDGSYSTRRYRRVQLFLVSIWISVFFSLYRFWVNYKKLLFLFNMHSMYLLLVINVIYFVGEIVAVSYQPWPSYQFCVWVKLLPVPFACVCQ